jgi:hypothetical protein
MADVLFRTAFLLLYATAWVLVFATLVTLRITWSIACWTWRTVPPLLARIRESRRFPPASRPLITGAPLH